MKVFNLRCGFLHGFEGWFASEDDYTQQLAKGLLSCPLCGDIQIQKMLSAPRLNLRTRREGSIPLVATDSSLSSDAVAESSPGTQVNNLQGQLLNEMRQLLANTEDVGDRFADQARAMHNGDMDPRSIRGRTTPEVAMELLEEGIDVVPLSIVLALKETLQ